ncbi:MAG: hypothetical protein JWP74_1195 [Marmoricola sp.]|nr:hypothetical protein [Marmoricola sp.]
MTRCRLPELSALRRGPLVLVDLSAGEDWEGAPLDVLRELTVGSLVVGVATEPLPLDSAKVLEHLTFTFAPSAPGRASVPVDDMDLEAVCRTVAAAPLASRVLVEVLRSTAGLAVRDGLVVESLAYSELLGGPEFASWRARTPVGATVRTDDAAVLVERDGDALQVVLNRPERHNAFGHRVRDLTVEALAVAELDPSIGEVVLRGNGPSFCSGGDLDEFGTAGDLDAAHRVRTEQSVGLAVHRLTERLGDRMRVQVHGACIGAGAEVPAFAGYVEAAADAYFCLPELGMGLIPGAGGTVSIPRRIGSWRTAYLALTGRRIDARTALDWGLVDAVT